MKHSSMTALSAALLSITVAAAPALAAEPMKDETTKGEAMKNDKMMKDDAMKKDSMHKDDAMKKSEGADKDSMKKH